MFQKRENFALELPQHFDGVNDANVSVAKTVQGAQGEGGEQLVDSLVQVGGQCLAANKLGLA